MAEQKVADVENDMKKCVIDNGSFKIKAGFGGEEAPRAVFSSLVGISKKAEQLEVYIGEEAEAKKGLLSLRYPVERGVVNNWDDMENLWNHTFQKQLGVDPAEVSVLLTENPLAPKEKREKSAEIMFERFKTSTFLLSLGTALSLYASGRTSGFVLESGDGVTHTVPVFEGYCVPHAVRRLNVAGNDMTEYLQKLLDARDISFTADSSSKEKDIVRDIKENVCYTPLDYAAEVVKHSSSSDLSLEYELPDGQMITMESERITVPEILFQPSMIGVKSEGIHTLAYQSIMECDEEIRKDLCGKMLMSGGSTMYEGLTQRIMQELKSLLPDQLPVEIIAPPERKQSVWRGGSILSSTLEDELWLTKDEYDEAGPSAVHRKCF